ncbi:chymotrypsin-1 [Nilaparvata lugens]|uniref:chymotrypsin-1 n=1 Tax=Nilaparvata lugens TaxID=108931 RepID=UPI00193E7CF0|nr:chymotrypsin-1 [Nilaparvata lugens]
MKFLIFTNLISSLFLLVNCERRIFGGSITTHGEFPYQVIVLLKNQQVCTGTIIDENWVITAAHCVMDGRRMASPSDVSVKAGFVRRALGPGHLMRAIDLAVHSDYRTLTGKQGLALIKVEEPFQFNEKIKKISLSDEPWPHSEGRMCTIAGYGSTENNTINELRFLQVKAFHGKNMCPCTTHNDQLEKLICLAPRRGQGACFGDSGGGLICEGKVEGIINVIMDKRTCKYFAVDRYTDCSSKHVYSTCMYVCPVLNWIRKYVPSVPPTPESCNKCNRGAPSVIVLLICLYIVVNGYLL